MTFNPFNERGIPLENQLRNWSELNVPPYRKEEIHPFSRARAILANGVEVESILFSHNMARNTLDPDVKKQLAFVRRIEAQQQKAINWMIPAEETTLEVTLGYEQIAVELTAWVAQNEPDPYLRQCYEFGVLEDFDHLYRYANLYDMIEGKKAEDIVGHLTEITPGRPTVFEHRHPYDEIRRPMTTLAADPQSLVNALTVLCAEQQVVNYYMNIGNRFQEPLARALYAEIAMIEEQHVTHYESILDPTATWLENWVLHEFNECWNYYSYLQEEIDPQLKAIWELHLAQELEHLRVAADMMRKIEKREPEALITAGEIRPLQIKENKAWLRHILGTQVDLTSKDSNFVPVRELPAEDRYFAYNRRVNGDWTPSEAVIQEHRQAAGGEYRDETDGPNPVPGLRENRDGASTGYAERVQSSSI
jgi:rubrerythrin